jgi:hypothetical protein
MPSLTFPFLDGDGRQPTTAEGTLPRTNSLVNLARGADKSRTVLLDWLRTPEVFSFGVA